MNKRLTSLIHKYNQLFVLWVILGGIGAFFYPGIFLSMKSGMELFFALTMFGIGLVLDPAAFIHILKKPWIIALGVAAQFTIMPGLAFVIAKLTHLPNELALGLILTGAAPGAMASNVLCYLAGADVAYSVSLTTFSTLLCPVLTPLLTLWLASAYFHIPFLDMFLSVIKMVLLPLLAGFILKRAFPKQTGAVQEIFPAVSTTFIVFICSLVIALNKAYLLQIHPGILLIVLSLNLGGLALGYLIGKTAGFDLLKRRALATEIGMQNAGLGSVLALKHFSERTAVPAALFVFVCILTASALVPLWRKKSAAP